MTSSSKLGHVFSIWQYMSTNFQRPIRIGSKRFKNDLWRHYDVISTKFRPCIFNPSNDLYMSTKFQRPIRIGSKRFKNDLWRHYDVISTKFRPCIFNPSNDLYMSTKFQRPIRIGSKRFKTTYDVIMTSSVPNLGHVFSILVMTCTCLPSFNVQFISEVSVLKTAYDVIMTSSVPNLGQSQCLSSNVQSVVSKRFKNPTTYDVISTKFTPWCFHVQFVSYKPIGFGGSGDQVRVRGPPSSENSPKSDLPRKRYASYWKYFLRKSN